MYQDLNEIVKQCEDHKKNIQTKADLITREMEEISGLIDILGNKFDMFQNNVLNQRLQDDINNQCLTIKQLQKDQEKLSKNIREAILGYQQYSRIILMNEIIKSKSFTLISLLESLEIEESKSLTKEIIPEHTQASQYFLEYQKLKMHLQELFGNQNRLDQLLSNNKTIICNDSNNEKHTRKSLEIKQYLVRQERVNVLNRIVNDNPIKINELNRELIRLEGEAEYNRRKINELTALMESKKSLIIELDFEAQQPVSSEKDLADLKKYIAALRSRLDSLSIFQVKEKKDIQTMIEKNKNMIDSIAKRVNEEKEWARKNAEERKKKIQVKVDEINEQLNNIQVRIHESDNKISEIKAQINTLAAQIQEARKELNLSTTE